MIKKILDIFFPYSCSICSIRWSSICKKCLQKLIFQKPYCFVTKNKSNNFYIQSLTYPIESIIIPFLYNKSISKIIKDWKYRNKKDNFIILTEYIIPFIEMHLVEKNNSVLVPVPLHFFKKYKRWFNQAEIMASVLSDALDLPLQKIVIRKRYTKAQSHLHKLQREKNVKNAFILNKKIDFKGKNIILIDDVISTGSTLFEIATLLKKNWAKKIFAVVFASDKTN